MSPKNLAASVHARLADIARKTGRPFQELLQYYAMERFLYHVRLTRLAARVGEQLGRDEPEAPTHSARPRKLATLSGLVDPGFGPSQKGRRLMDGPESIRGERDWLAATFARGRRCAFQGVHPGGFPVQGAF
jgi:hypothetical protein